MHIETNETFDVPLTDYCCELCISYDEAVNNIIAEFFLERKELQDDKTKD